MVYTKKFYYQRVIDVQDLTLEVQSNQPDLLLKEIHAQYIEPRWRISMRTYSNYLAVNAKALIKEYDEPEIDPNQLELF